MVRRRSSIAPATPFVHELEDSAEAAALAAVEVEAEEEAEAQKVDVLLAAAAEAETARELAKVRTANRLDSRQRVLRGLLQVVVSLLPILPQLREIVLGTWSSQWLVATMGQLIAIQVVLTQIMAIPAVDGWLGRLGLGKETRDSYTT
ncbi:hypothetical protein GCM10022198_14780 [Klugiella xanthotipulae]|uniref:Uncharacterized protein n=1 Tax=Klugiella xanthotipulae TaxID=244735 RepID=A0A543I6W0_9MICO|nr:hypothetical protein [Klugiella xanthotipulae]TQM66230.1 hypothetical protein FB466_1064 [Klugiella xanthotipulae]